MDWSIMRAFTIFFINTILKILFGDPCIGGMQPVRTWFIGSINDWYEEVRLAEAAEEDKLDELGFFDDAEDAGPVIFNSEPAWEQIWEF